MAKGYNRSPFRQGVIESEGRKNAFHPCVFCFDKNMKN